MALQVLSLIAVATLATPLVLSHMGRPLDAMTSVLLTTTGVFLLVVAGVALLVTRLYVKTKSSEAFVRTGAGGVSVIRDGGALIIPVVHELVRVSLQTLKLEVSRMNEDALITQDKLRADVHAEFFVRVQPDKDSILQASRSLGDKMKDPRLVKDVVGDKLVSALRTAAAGKTLEQLNSERDEFLAEVMKLVTEDLRSNGLILESVTISRLDQTDEQFLKEENIFDAQGRRKIAEITQANLTERNRLLRDGEEARKRQDVQTAAHVFELEKTRREAEARQRAEIMKIEADTTRDASERAIEAKRQVELAEVEKTRALEIAARLQQQAVEVAEREKQERVAEAERKRALAEQALADAEADRELSRQRIETVKVTEAAERARKQQVVEAQADAETKYVTEQRRADAEAYAIQRQAEARQLAADAEAEAIRKRAMAEAEAARQLSEGEQAKAMVPVNVRRAEVDVERDRLETVIKPELEAREAHGKTAQDFELAKLRVAAEREIRVAMAEASATLFEKVNANLYGTPEDVTKIVASLTSGQSAATALSGFLSSTDDSTRAIVSNLVEKAAGVLEARSSSNGVSARSEQAIGPVAAPTPEAANGAVD